MTGWSSEFKEGLNTPHGKGAWRKGLQGVTRKPLSYGPSPNDKGPAGNSEQRATRLVQSFLKVR